MLVLTICVQKLMYPLVLAPVGLLHRSGMEHRPATIVHFLLLLVLVVLCFFVAPAAVFSTVEMSWSFLDGIYFCFISLCTIGLGDFVPGTQPGQKYRSLYQVGVMGECSCYYIPCRFMVVCECFYSHSARQHCSMFDKEVLLEHSDVHMSSSLLSMESGLTN